MHDRAYLWHVQGAHVPARRRAGRHRILRRPRHVGRRRVDARQGRRPLHLHRQPRAVRRAGHRLGAGSGRGLRRGDRPSGRLPRRPGRGGAGGADLRGVPHPLGRPPLLQHHPAGPRGHRHPAGARHARGRRPDLGRRVDVQGQRHRTVLPVRPAGQPVAADLQAVAGRRLRAASSAAARRCRSGCSPTTCPTGTAPRRRTPPTRTSGARRTRRRRSSTWTPAWKSSSPSWGSGSGTRRSRSRPRT